MNTDFNMIIREAEPAEAETLSSLALRSKAYWGYSSEFMLACRKELTYSAEQILSQDYRFFLGEIAGVCTGFYAISRTSQETAELEALFIEPSHIGKGYGRTLIKHAKVVAGALGFSRLTLQSDTNAAEFYRAMGSVFVGERESASIPGRYLPVYSIELST